MLSAGLVLGITLLPALLNLSGFSFDMRVVTFSPDGLSDIDRQHLALHGSFIHAILEWAAVFTAVFTTFLAFVNFYIHRDRVVLIVAASLLCGAIMDAFHILSTTWLIHATKDLVNFGPFTWAVSRLFTAIVLIFGACVVLLKKGQSHQGSKRGIWIPFSVMAVIAWGTIKFCTSFEALPHTMFPAQFIKRPYDLAALILFAIVVPLILFQVCRRFGGVFAWSLLLSMIPQAGAQIYVTFGSAALFDNSFTVAHFLKVVAYLIPLGGLCAQYILSLRSERAAIAGLIQSKKLAFLGQLSAGAAHEINNPLTVVKGLSEILEYKAGANQLGSEDVIRIARKINQNADRIVRIVSSLKILAGEKHQAASAQVSVRELFERTLDLTRASAGNQAVEIIAAEVPDDLLVAGDYADLIQILLNLVQNALQALASVEDGRITLGIEDHQSGFVELTVEDNGLGIASENEHRLFTPFFTTREVGTGPGLGLSTSLAIAQKHGGDLRFTRYRPGVKISLKLPRIDTVSAGAA